MNPALVLALLNASMTLIEHIPAMIEILRKSGTLTPEQDAALDARIANLPNLDHWKPTPTPLPPPAV